MEKIYKVEFMEYTDYLHDAVKNEDTINSEYLEIGLEPFLVKESELNKYMKYGKGFRTIKFVGNLMI